MTAPAGKPRAVSFHPAGDRIAATLFGYASERVPAVVLCTGFSGTQDTPSIVATAEAFVAEGWIVMTFDYRGFGRSQGEPRQVVSVRAQLEDIHSAVGYLRSRGDIDPDRVALWGSSLGGGHVITIAAADPRIAAVVAQVPFNGFPKQSQREGQTMKGAYALLWAAIRDRLRGWTGRPPLYLKAVGSEGERAVMVSPDANRAIEVLGSDTWRNQVAPRGLLDMMFYRPGKYAHQIDAPVLVCVGEYDREANGGKAAALAHDAPRGELRTYPFTHFEFYRPENRVLVLADQVEFLRRALSDPS